MHKVVTAVVFVLFSIPALASPDWSKGAPVPPEGRHNIYDWNPSQFYEHQRAGRIHSSNYPVDVTGILLPYRPIKRFSDSDMAGHLTRFLSRVLGLGFEIKSFDGLQEWLGLHEYPSEEGDGPYWVPHPQDLRPDDRMGLSRIARHGATGFTYSCAACHTGNLFGQKVIGMTNRFPRAYDFFHAGEQAMKFVGPNRLRMLMGASKNEARVFGEAKQNLKSVATRRPQFLGLDTSMAHTALSLSKRKDDEYATKSRFFQRFPRKDKMETFVADSKPAVWWNLKYKNKFLLDGSVVSGNPVMMALLVNEIGRGTDLRQFESWVDQNQQVIDELTTAAFATEAPAITDFFDARRIDLADARRGQQVFNNSCAKCHGHYDKAWEIEGFEALPYQDQLRTVRVRYHEDTPIKDVGTDPNRYMGAMLKLNKLYFSKKHGISFELQKGYVPPPLEGIWARWPYLHNNSIPNLCVLLTPEDQRVKEYYMGEANDPERDFDFDCNGYPLGNKTPNEWKVASQIYRAGGPGLSNKGHKAGTNLPADDKYALIKFLQTL